MVLVQLRYDAIVKTPVIKSPIKNGSARCVSPNQLGGECMYRRNPVGQAGTATRHRNIDIRGHQKSLNPVNLCLCAM